MLKRGWTDPETMVTHVAQRPDDNDCAVAVACMIVGVKDKDEAHFWHGTEVGKGWFDCQVMAFLLKHGVAFGTGLHVADDGMMLSPSDTFGLDVTLQDQPCYMSVKSRSSEKGLHAVYWDGQSVWDPNPSFEPRAPLSDYEVTDFWPLYELPEDQAQCLADMVFDRTY